MWAALMKSGVSKSGSPAPRPIMSRPCRFNSSVLVVSASVAEGVMRSSAAEVCAMVIISECLICRRGAIDPAVPRLQPVVRGQGPAMRCRCKSHGQGDRKSVVSGKSVSVRVDIGGRRIIKKKQEDDHDMVIHT